MKLKNITLTLFLTALTACGGSKEKTISAELTLPPTLTQSVSTTGSYQYALTLLDSSTHVAAAGPLTLTQSTDPQTPNTYQVIVPDLPDGSYEAHLLCISSTYSLPMAEVVKTINVSGNTSTLSLQPSDFNLDLDQDGDTLTNFNEIQRGLNPSLSDSDRDGVPDNADAFALDASDSLDEDNDGIGNNHDNCIVSANTDQIDTDRDGRGNACDTDDDNDGILDTTEVSLGTNPLDTDSDDDGFDDQRDNCPLVINANQLDTDRDGLGDACDPDADNDEVRDTADNCPLVANTDQIDTDTDAVGNACDSDDDADTIADAQDNCPLVANTDQVDTDHDLLGNACDSDDDNDGLSDIEEAGLGSDHLITNPLATDTDGDGVTDNTDNCAVISNADQTDTDRDLEGDACDCDPNDAQIKIRNGIFVATSGIDTNTGAQNQPVRTLARAISLAQGSQSAVYLTEGTYAEPVSLPDGLSLKGGFTAGSSCLRNFASHPTTLTSNADVTLNIVTDQNPATVEGVIVQNTGTASQTTAVSIISPSNQNTSRLTFQNNTLLGGSNATQYSRGVFVDKASPLFLNNAIFGGGSRSSIGLEMRDSSVIKLINNTIHGGRSSHASWAVKLRNSSPTLLNNILLTERVSSGIPGSSDDQKLVFHDGSGVPSGLVMKNNLLKGVASPELPKFFSDSFGSAETNITSFNLLDGVSGGAIDNNITSTQPLSSIIVDTTTNNYHLVSGSDAINAGISPDTIGLNLINDRDGNSRPRGGSYDIGAFEY